jgi:ketosteroid isomerase-like protein
VKGQVDSADVIRRYFETVRSNVAAVTDRYAPDAVIHYIGRHSLGGDHHGRDEIRALFARSHEAFRGTQRLDLHEVIANQNHAVALLHASAERDGRRLQWRRIVVFHLEGDLIKEQWIHDSDQHVIEDVLA